MAIESLSSLLVASPAAVTVAQNAAISSSNYSALLNILDDLVDHTHLFTDDYADYVAPHSNCVACCDTCNI